MKKKKLDILYEDKYLLIVNKPAHLLTISTDNEKENTLYHQVYTYLKQKHKSNKVFIVHRLDKDTSGIILFAKSEFVKNEMQTHWNAVKRKYYAIVNGNVPKNKDTIKSYLKETKSLLVYSTKDGTGKLAITEYEKLKSINNYTLLDINILTGRKNQIRVHLNDLGHPIVGDKKYSNIKNKVKRLMLHAYYIEFYHPITKELICIKTNYPKEFLNIIEY